MNNHAKQTVKQPSRSWRDRASISTAVVILVTLSILTSGIITGIYARGMIERAKLDDVWAIMFLESERRGADLARLLTAETPGLSAEVVERGGRIFRKSVDAPDSLLAIPDQTFARVLGAKTPASALVYIVSRDGALIASNSSEITPAGFVGRPLVQRFIAAPLSGSILEFTSVSGDPAFGFFHEVPGTNLVLFSEARKRDALGDVNALTGRYLAILVIVVLVVLAALIWPMLQMVGPLTTLTRLVRAVGAGHRTVRMSVAASPGGIGEVRELAAAFDSMVGELATRDTEIERLSAQKIEQARLAAELKIAQGVQSSLLPQSRLPLESGVDIAAVYIPATECAGDWYFQHYNKAAHETIVAVVDVSGHGAGASIFTALIAGVFDRFAAEEIGRWDIDKLLQNINSLLHRIGRREWHATLCIAVIREGEVTLHGAGHVPPYVVPAVKSDAALPQRLPLPSMALGLSEELSIRSKSIPFPKGTSLVFYTDGLTEAKGEDGRVVSIRTLAKTLRDSSGESSRTDLDAFIRAWRTEVGATPLEDDVCVVYVRAA